MKQRLCQEIAEDEDSLRIYRLHVPRAKVVQAFGIDGYISFTDPLVL